MDGGRRISIHALREEGDFSIIRMAPPVGVFLSTPSVRRATDLFASIRKLFPNFYPRPP